MSYESQPKDPQLLERLVVVEQSISAQLSERLKEDYQRKPTELREEETRRKSLIGRGYGVMCGGLMLGTYIGLRTTGAITGVPVEADLLGIIAMARIPSKVGQLLPRLHSAALEQSFLSAEHPAIPWEYHHNFWQRIGLIPDLLRMWTPNLLHPGKLVSNLKNPLGEVFHTRHHQYPLDTESNIFAVEHEFFGRKVTLDLVKPNRFPKSWLLRTMQLFDPNFYYGHANYFPQPFELIDRAFLPREWEEFNLDDHLKRVLERREGILDKLTNFVPAKIEVDPSEIRDPNKLPPSRRLAYRILQFI